MWHSRNLPEVMREVAERHPGKRIALWFQDAWKQSFQGVGQKGRATRVWYARGVRPRRPVQIGYHSAWLFGAVCPHQDRGCALVLPIATTAAMNACLAALSTHVADDAHAVIVLDRAGWHTANDLRVPANLTLVRLPPDSPELNPVEKLWQYLRERSLSHRVLPDDEAVVTAACDAWNRLIAEPGRIASLTSFPWLPASVSNS